MVATGRAAQQYLQTHVRSRTPLELVVMLYDRAIASIATAADAAGRRDIRTRRDAVSNALAVVQELQCSLDRDRGGDVAAELDRLYDWIASRLVDATVRQEVAPLHEARRVLETLRDGWQQIASAPVAAGPAR